MRIGLLFEYPTLNGGERSMLAALDAMGSDRPDVVAIAPPSGPLAEELQNRKLEHVRLHATDADGKRLPRDVFAALIAEAAEPLQLDLLHANSLSMGVVCGELAEPPFVLVSHIRDIISLSKNAVRLLNQNDRLVAVSEATRAYHVGQGIDPNRIHVAHNGVDCDTFRPVTSLRQEQGVSNESLVCLTIGQIGLRKGLEVLVAAICDLGPKVPGMTFLIVGERHSSKRETIEYEERLHTQLAAGGMSDRVRWLGYQPQVHQLMNDADILVHVAHQEPLGRVLLEAAASGLPIVATDVGGTAEILQHETSAILVEKGNAQQVSNAISQLGKSRALRKRLGNAAREVAETRFTDVAAAQRLRAHWVAALANRR